jgi:FHA domain-containing protein
MLPRADTRATLLRAGALFRRLVEVVWELALTRARIRSEMPVSPTVINASRNNPFKFLGSSDDVIISLLIGEKRGYLGSEDALDEIAKDLATHQFVLLSAAKDAIGTILRKLDPVAFEQANEKSTLVSAVLPATKKAALWDQYKEEFARLKEDAEHTSHGFLARALARAYEDAERNR